MIVGQICFVVRDCMLFPWYISASAGLQVDKRPLVVATDAVIKLGRYNNAGQAAKEAGIQPCSTMFFGAADAVVQERLLEQTHEVSAHFPCPPQLAPIP